MEEKNLYQDKKSCKDVFNAMMLENAFYEGNLELPIIKGTKEIPVGLIPFSRIKKSEEYEKWIHFYEYDQIIERLWNYPYKYLPYLKKFKGVILPDFSLFEDMPLLMQMYNILRSRMVGNWLQNNGVNVIVNMRYGDHRTYKICCIGAPKNSTIAIGTHGSMKSRESREILEKGLLFIFNNLQPNTLIVYGTASEFIVSLCNKYNTKLVVFQSDFGKSHSLKKEVI